MCSGWIQYRRARFSGVQPDILYVFIKIVQMMLTLMIDCCEHAKKLSYLSVECK